MYLNSCIRKRDMPLANLAVILTAAMLLIGGSGRLSAQDFTEQRLKVQGRWNGVALVAERVKHRDRVPDPLLGVVKVQVDSVAPTGEVIHAGPVRILLTSNTRWEGIRLHELQPGQFIKVKGRLKALGVLVAREVQEASSDKGEDYMEVVGMVNAGEQKRKDRIYLEILGVPVEVSIDIYDRGLALVRRPDDKRPDRQLTVPLFGRPLIVGGEFSSRSRYDGDFKLKRSKPDDKLRLENGLQLELFYRLSRHVSVFVEGKSGRDAVMYSEAGERESVEFFERGESWIYLSHIGGGPYSLQIGRQNFREPRQWWWNEDLDAIRFYFNRRNFYFELGVAREMASLSTDERDIDPEQKGVLRVLGRASTQWSGSQRFDLFYLIHHDASSRPSPGEVIPEHREDPRDATLVWLGPRFSGKLDFRPVGEIRYWLDGAVVGGRETIFSLEEVEDDLLQVTGHTTVNVAGWAFDGGLNWLIDAALEPTLTVGYAVGSGDGASASKWDRTFRQTGLHQNNNKFNGVDRFRYYGELFRPELSNIRILTLAMGLSFLGSSSLELLYHRYRQYAPAEFQRGIRIKADPDGEHLQLGQAWEVILGVEEWEHIEVELIGAYFRAGRAFGILAGQDAFQVVLKTDFNF